jgi:trans-2-enoyl-CoA reductase
MKQVVCTQHSDDPTKAVDVVEVAPPACPEAGVVVAVRARPINPADLLLLTGRHLYRPKLPEPVGIEGAGVVVEAGQRSRLAVGDIVAIPWGGTWRERMALGDDDVLPVSKTVDLEQAAMLSVNPFTAAGLLEGVAPGECVAVNAANSAVARLVLMMARARGIQTIAIARSEANEADARALGAEAFVVDGPGLTERLRAAAPRPIRRALDAVAGESSGRLFDALAEGGTLVVYGLLSSDTISLPAAGVVFRDVHVQGYSRLRALRALPRARREEVTAELVGMLERGELRSEVDARYPLEEAKAALAHHERPGRRGKILVIS